MRRKEKKQIPSSSVDQGFYHTGPPITDRFDREFDYLRLAVNEYCNLRCIYCMPEEGVPFKEKEKLLITNNLFGNEKLFRLSLGKKKHIKVKLK